MIPMYLSIIYIIVLKVNLKVVLIIIQKLMVDLYIKIKFLIYYHLRQVLKKKKY